MLGFYILLRAFGIPAQLAGWRNHVGILLLFILLISAGHLWKFITLLTSRRLLWPVSLLRGRLLLGGIVTASSLPYNYIEPRTDVLLLPVVILFL